MLVAIPRQERDVWKSNNFINARGRVVPRGLAAECLPETISRSNEADVANPLLRQVGIMVRNPLGSALINITLLFLSHQDRNKYPPSSWQIECGKVEGQGCEELCFLFLARDVLMRLIWITVVPGKGQMNHRNARRTAT